MTQERWNAIGIGIAATIATYLICLATGWLTITSINALEIFCVATSYTCTYLCVVQDRWNYPLGAISSAAYCVLFWQQDLLGSAGLNLYLVPALLYGWFRWGKNDNTRPVTHLTWDHTLLIYAAVVATCYFATRWFVYYLGGTLAPADSAILVFTIFAQFLLDNKKLETWAVWVVVNVLAIYVYFSTNLPMVGLQYVVFLANTIYGWYCWRKTMSSKSEQEDIKWVHAV